MGRWPRLHCATLVREQRRGRAQQAFEVRFHVAGVADGAGRGKDAGAGRAAGFFGAVVERHGSTFRANPESHKGGRATG